LKFIRFLKSKWFTLNLMAAIVVLAFVIIAFFILLKKYTNHGESLTVPDLKGMSVEQAENQISSRNLRYKIVDSVYSAEQPGNTILDQNPWPSSKVKRNRTVYLTVSTTNPPEVRVPNIMNVSLRQAVRMLESYGLKAGQLHYIPDVARNSVLGLKVKGKIIEPGQALPKGTEIDLILGDGLVTGIEKVPNLIGLSLEEATLVMKGWGFNIGSIIYEGDINDRSTAKIFRQEPMPGPNAQLPQGEVVDIWLVDANTYYNEYQNREEDYQEDNFN
jgi:eukaryotic-like serine/threonine-protein kinase